MRDKFINDVFSRFGNSPSEFRNSLLIEASGKLVPFSQSMDRWQRDDFEALDAAWLRCLGRTEDNTSVMRGFLERPRGHSKSMDCGVMILWALISSTRLVRGHAYAASKQQSAILRDSIQTTVRNNPWLQYKKDDQTGHESGIISVDKFIVKPIFYSWGCDFG